MARDVRVAIVADANQLKREMRQAEASAKGFGDKFRDTASRVGQAATVMGTAIGVGVAAFSVQAIKVASDTDEAMNVVRVSFGESSAAVESFAESSAKSMGISRREYLQTAGQFGALLRSFGLGETASANLSTRLIALSSDLSSFYNANPTDVLEALRAGLVGEAEPLRKFGITISAARVEQEALNQGLWDGEDALSSSAKAQAIFALMLQDTTVAQGDFANTIDSTANRAKVLGAVFDDLKGQLGEKLLPVANVVLGKMIEGVDALSVWWDGDGQRWMDQFQSGWTRFKDSLDVVKERWNTNFVPAFKRGLEVIGEWLDGVRDKFNALKVVIRVMAYQFLLFLLNNLGAVTRIRSAVSSVIEMAAGIGPWLISLASTVGGFVSGMVSVAGGAISWVLDRAREVSEVLKQIGDNPFFKALLNVSTGGLSGAVGGIGGLIGGMFDMGGVVPGPKGAARVAVVHGGETILPTHKNAMPSSGPSSVTVNVVLDRKVVGTAVADILRQDRRTLAGIGAVA